MAKIKEFFDGKKTYIIGIGIGIVAALFAAGIITKELSEILLTMLGGGAVLTLREAIGKSTPAGADLPVADDD